MGRHKGSAEWRKPFRYVYIYIYTYIYIYAEVGWCFCDLVSPGSHGASSEAGNLRILASLAEISDLRVRIICTYMQKSVCAFVLLDRQGPPGRAQKLEI